MGKVGDYTLDAAPSGTEELTVKDGAATKRVTVQSIADLASAGAPVSSVNGQTGVVVLDAGDVGAQPVDADLTALASAGNSAVLVLTTAAFTTADETKLDGIEAGADVTDATNVAAAGAVMTTGDQTVAGVKSYSNKVVGQAGLDLSTGTAVASGAGSGIGDKIALYTHSSQSGAYGLGLAAGKVVAYIGSGGTSFSVRSAAASPPYSAGTVLVDLGKVGPSSQEGIAIGSSGDTVLYRSAADTLRTPDALTVDGELQTGNRLFLSSSSNGYIHMIELGSAPAVPSANGMRLFVQDDGAGNTQVVARFATGSDQIIARQGGTPDGQLPINAQSGTTYSPVLADAGKLVELGNAAAIALTVPTNASVAYPVGTQIHLLQTGAGQVTVAGAGGVTVNGNPGLKLNGQWAAATLIKRATDTWVLIGNIAA